ncbi:MAG: peptidylprolyl isomerase [Deltaproteobacteria bacterium]|nr:peptidylprolyl isomerase [Deltaproteobacteria bacterium]
MRKTLILLILACFLMAPLALAATNDKPGLAPVGPRRDAVQKDTKSMDPKNKVVARVGGEEVTQADVDAILYADPARFRDKPPTEVDKLNALDGLLVNLVLAAEARRTGLDKDPAIAKKLTKLENQILSKAYSENLTKGKVNVTDEQMKEFYEKNKDAFYDKPAIKVFWILVDTKEDADKLFAEMKKSPANQVAAGAEKAKAEDKVILASPHVFRALAAKYSKDTATAPKGGWVPWFNKGEKDPEVEKVALALTENELSRPVKGQNGWYLILKEAQTEGKQNSFLNSRSIIYQKLVDEQERKIIGGALDRIKKDVTVELISKPD